MTDEEKIKKARGIICHDCIWSGCTNNYCPALRSTVKAIELGLAEGKPKWHDLRKDPNDLPDNGRRVLVKDKSRKEYDIACLCRSKPDSDFWSYERFTTRVKDNYVVAWCDFPRFEE